MIKKQGQSEDRHTDMHAKVCGPCSHQQLSHALGGSSQASGGKNSSGQVHIQPQSISSTRAREADTRAREADTGAREADTGGREADTRVREADTRVREADTRVREADTRVREADIRVREANLM